MSACTDSSAYYGNQKQIEYDSIVAPGRNPGRVQIRFDGAESIDVDAIGDLVLHLPSGGEVRQRRPLAYPERKGMRHLVAAHYQTGRRRGRMT